MSSKSSSFAEPDELENFEIIGKIKLSSWKLLIAGSTMRTGKLQFDASTKKFSFFADIRKAKGTPNFTLGVAELTPLPRSECPRSRAYNIKFSKPVMDYCELGLMDIGEGDKQLLHRYLLKLVGVANKIRKPRPSGDKKSVSDVYPGFDTPKRRQLIPPQFQSHVFTSTNQKTPLRRKPSEPEWMKNMYPESRGQQPPPAKKPVPGMPPAVTPEKKASRKRSVRAENAEEESEQIQGNEEEEEEQVDIAERLLLGEMEEEEGREEIAESASPSTTSCENIDEPAEWPIEEIQRRLSEALREGTAGQVNEWMANTGQSRIGALLKALDRSDVTELLLMAEREVREGRTENMSSGWLLWIQADLRADQAAIRAQQSVLSIQLSQSTQVLDFVDALLMGQGIGDRSDMRIERS